MLQGLGIKQAVLADLGGIDISPIVVIFGLVLLQDIIRGVLY